MKKLLLFLLSCLFPFTAHAMLFKGGFPTTNANYYTAEDGVTLYVAEDGVTNYIQEVP